MYILFFVFLSANQYTKSHYKVPGADDFEIFSTESTIIFQDFDYFCPNLFYGKDIEESPNKCYSTDQIVTTDEIVKYSSEQIFSSENNIILKSIDNMFKKRIGELESSINKRFTHMDTDLNDLKNMTTNMNTDLNDLKNMTTNMDTDLNDLKNMTTNMDTKLINLSLKVDQNFYRQNGTYAKNSSILSTGIIQIDPPSKKGNCYASGNLVNINGSLFFSTCRHVAMFSDCYMRQIKMIQLYEGPKLKAKGPIYIFSDNNTHFDYALIKVIETDELFSRAATISNELSYLSEIVRGISYRDFNIVYVEGQILEIDQNETNVYQTDCGGSHGFSGSGYFDEYGKLKVIHHGSGQFLGEEEEEFDYDGGYSKEFFQKVNTPKIDSIENAFEYCRKKNLSNKTKKFICYNKISSSINMHARNPRTMVLGAHLFYDLIFNKSKKTLSLEQGQNLTLINGTYVPLEIKKNITDVNNTDSNNSTFNDTLIIH